LSDCPCITWGFSPLFPSLRRLSLALPTIIFAFGHPILSLILLRGGPSEPLCGCLAAGWGQPATVIKPYPSITKLLRDRTGEGKFDKSCQSSSLSTAKGKLITVRESDSRASLGGRDDSLSRKPSLSPFY